VTAQRKPNERLRAARLRVESPSGSGQPMSRQELAELVNVYLAELKVGWLCMDANHIGKYERGRHTWPHWPYRRALRAVLGAASDAELGFHTGRTVAASPVIRPLAATRRGAVTVAALTERPDGAPRPGRSNGSAGRR
jgi:hypothetical protein